MRAVVKLPKQIFYLGVPQRGDDLKVVDIKQGRTDYEKKLATLQKSLDFKELVGLIEFCLKKKLYYCHDLLSLWRNNSNTFKPVNSIDSILELFSETGRTYVIENTIADVAIETSAVLNEYVTSMMDIIEEKKLYYNSYSWFSPAINISSLLEELYSDDLNPGKIIAKYLKPLFPEKVPEDFSEFISVYTNDPIYAVPFDSPLSILLTEVCLWAIEQSIQDDFIRTCMVDSIHDMLGETRERTSTVGETIVALHQAPTSYYRSWVYNWLLNENHHSNASHKLSSDDLMIALLCISFGKGNKPLVCELEFRNSISNKSLLHYFEGKRASRFTFFPFSTFVGILSVFSFSVTIDSEYYSIFQKLISNSTKYRIDFLSGIFPFEPTDINSTWHINNMLLENDNDLLLLLSSSSMETSDLLYLIPDEENLAYHELAGFYNERQKTYLLLTSKAYSEGFYELGTALLSLYLLYRTIFLKGRLGASPELIETINKALSFPGHKILKRTLTIAVESVEEHFSADPLAMSSIGILRQYLPQGADLHVLDGGKGAHHGESEIRSLLKSELGDDRWDKLSASSQNSLVSAELQWKNSAIEFGFGIKDWSGLVITYCKAIEGELVDRLRDFFLSNEYEAYLTARGDKRPGKPTAGWLLKEFRSHDRMPQDLKELSSKARIRFIGNHDLVSRLYDIFQNYRNISAHPDAISMKRFAAFKEELFQKRLLHQFIDAFC